MQDQLLQQAHIIRKQRGMTRQKRQRYHRLDPFQRELLRLADAGFSHRELALWLQTYKRIQVAHTTIGRALKRWELDTDESTIAASTMKN